MLSDESGGILPKLRHPGATPLEPFHGASIRASSVVRLPLSLTSFYSLLPLNSFEETIRVASFPCHPLTEKQYQQTDPCVAVNTMANQRYSGPFYEKQ